VKMGVKNIGDTDFTNVSWSIAVFGGMFDQIGRYKTGTIPLLRGGDTALVGAFPIFGFGDVDIEVTVSMPGVNVIRKRAEGVVFGPVIIVSS